MTGRETAETGLTARLHQALDTKRFQLLIDGPYVDEIRTSPAGAKTAASALSASEKPVAASEPAPDARAWVIVATGHDGDDEDALFAFIDVKDHPEVAGACAEQSVAAPNRLNVARPWVIASPGGDARHRSLVPPLQTLQLFRRVGVSVNVVGRHGATGSI